MKRLIGLICILVGIFLMIGMLFKNEDLFHLSFSREKPVTKKLQRKKEEIDQLDISLSGFRVKVKPENRSDISVTAVNGKGKMYAEQTGGTFKIRAENKSFLFFTQFEKGELLVKIPTDYHKKKCEDYGWKRSQRDERRRKTVPSRCDTQINERKPHS
ncbi:hypothetical protein BsIDN1_58160 [Bacillus safensis]|uniref:DUF4097 domain-containing protein n=1 Tax=Bacillus safensis TaxID=561879 RepID=A0A5S9MGL3_BACIA|nr:hypothetical protein BsIDN1_58160 [Bacillus safensis]